mmetsp:Transcript_68894/g.222695  ORF Transcript_68894/g.222695 Transcript_68894/m.222695 type:complete len:245 (-) Transcript_68894:100-834(-)
MQFFQDICCNAKSVAADGLEVAGQAYDTAKHKAGKHTLKELKKSLEGSKSLVSEKPDIYVTILQVNFQDGLDIDIMNFNLSGLKCRVKLELTGTKRHMAAMVATDQASKLMGAAAGLVGVGTGAASALEGMRDSVHQSAADSSETRELEFDINLDLGVRKAGEEVSAGVSIVGDALDEVNKVIPVKTAVQYVEKAIADKVKEIISDWAKNTVKNKTGVDVDATKQMVVGKVDQAKGLLAQAGMK